MTYPGSLGWPVIGFILIEMLHIVLYENISILFYMISGFLEDECIFHIYLLFIFYVFFFIHNDINKIET